MPYVHRDDWGALIDAGATPRDRALLALLLFTGLRIAEACGLDWPDIRWESRKVRVRHGKGGKARTASCKAEALDLLREYRDGRRWPFRKDEGERRKDEGGQKAAGPGSSFIPQPSSFPEDPVFVSREHGRLTTRQARNVVYAAVAAAGLDQRLHPHACRRGHATALYEKTGDLRLVADQLGHQRTSTTEDHYIRSAQTKRQRAVEDL